MGGREIVQGAPEATPTTIEARRHGAGENRIGTAVAPIRVRSCYRMAAGATTGMSLPPGAPQVVME